VALVLAQLPHEVAVVQLLYVGTVHARVGECALTRLREEVAARPLGMPAEMGETDPRDSYACHGTIYVMDS